MVISERKGYSFILFHSCVCWSSEQTRELNGFGFSSSLQISCSMEKGEVVGL